MRKNDSGHGEETESHSHQHLVHLLSPQARQDCNPSSTKEALLQWKAEQGAWLGLGLLL